MIRYVVAVILTVVIVTVAMGGVDYAAAANSERMVSTGVAEFQDAAVSLYQEDELPPEGHEGPQRFVTIDMPARSLTETPVEHFEVRRVDDRQLTIVTYRLEGGDMNTETIDVPITNAEGSDVVELAGTQDQTLVLTLVRGDDDRPVVKVVRQPQHFDP